MLPFVQLLHGIKQIVSDLSSKALCIVLEPLHNVEPLEKYMAKTDIFQRINFSGPVSVRHLSFLLSLLTQNDKPPIPEEV